MKMIRVTPTPGMKIRNPANEYRILPDAGDVVPDDAYWHRRAAEGGVTISSAIEEPAAEEPATAAAAKPKK